MNLTNHRWVLPNDLQQAGVLFGAAWTILGETLVCIHGAGNNCTLAPEWTFIEKLRQQRKEDKLPRSDFY
jgi:hypothetical protein